MARDLIEEVVDGHGHAAFFLAAGRLIEREECARADARAAFPGAWKRLDREKLVGWMRA
jgi:hypothetical protein